MVLCVYSHGTIYKHDGTFYVHECCLSMMNNKYKITYYVDWISYTYNLSKNSNTYRVSKMGVMQQTHNNLLVHKERNTKNVLNGFFSFLARIKN